MAAELDKLFTSGPLHTCSGDLDDVLIEYCKEVIATAAECDADEVDVAETFETLCAYMPGLDEHLEAGQLADMVELVRNPPVPVAEPAAVERAPSPEAPVEETPIANPSRPPPGLEKPPSSEHDAALSSLMDIFPTSDPGDLLGALQAVGGNVDAAVEHVFQHGMDVRLLSEERNGEAENMDPSEAARLKKRVLDRYLLQEKESKIHVKTSRPVARYSAADVKPKEKTQIRFLNNAPVRTRGKYITVDPRESEDMQSTYVKLNVITKGKRGK